MAVNEINVDVPPHRVFAVLADPDCYGKWVVGSSQIRDVDGPWPAEGAQFHHTQGVGPVGIKDTTQVLRADEGRQLVMEVRARPVIVAEVTMDLEPDGAGTKVTMTEIPVRGWLGPLRRFGVDQAIKLRNAESLRRLKNLAER